MSQNGPIRRLLLAAGWTVWLVALFVGVPLAWSGALARWFAFGLSARPYWPLMVLVLVAVVAALSRWLPWDARPRLGAMSMALVAGWCFVHSGCWVWQVSDLSAPGVVVIYLSTTISLACAAHLWLTKAAWPRCVKQLAFSLIPLLLSAAVVDCGGLDGNGRPIVGWRFESVVSAASLPVAEQRAKPHDLSPAIQQDFPAFRGDDGSGVVRGVKLRSGWSSHAPRLLWRRNIGKGWGGFAVAGGYAFTQEQRDSEESVVCYQAATGHECWVHADPVCFTSATVGDGPRATPAVRDGRVYSLGATGLLNCLDAKTGERYWSVDVLAEHHTGNLYHGLSGSPLVVGDLVVVSVGGSGRSLVAYDRHSGRPAWHAGDDPAGYGSPLVCTLGGRPQIMILTQAGLAAHDVSTGDVLWTFPWTNDTGTNCSQPLPLGDDRLFVSTGYGRGCALVRAQPTANGWSVEPLWTSRNLKTKFCSPVELDGFVYGLDEGVLVCVDLRDGSRRWRAGRYGHGQLLLVDDLLCVQCEAGQLALVAADPTAHRELARCDALAEKTWNYPALAGRLLLVRNDREAICFELPAY
ncbi:MAG TPA: PQQ-binding-like beta-propeller repeat protein [Pirellulales bacterium]|nr:PQQ-binding-like beta-propeller repeat protein [Pirellulales bacterium]